MTEGARGARLQISFILALLGAIVGALVAIPVTWLGKIIAEAPDPATLSNYLWNMRVLAIMGAVFGPLLAWSSLRRVPLWRAALEPGLGALVGAILGMLTGSDALFLLATACGVWLPAWRLQRVFREEGRLAATQPPPQLP